MMLFAQWDQLNQPGIIGYMASAAVFMSLITTAVLFLERWLKLAPELKQLRQDIMQKAAETLSFLQEKRDAYDDAVDRWTQSAIGLRQAIEDDDTESLDGHREECCRLFSSEVMRAHINYVEFEALYNKGDYDALEEFVTDDLVDDIKRLTRWLSLLNSPKLMAMIPDDRSVLKITRQSIKPWRKIALGLPSGRRSTVRAYLELHIDKLLEPET